MDTEEFCIAGSLDGLKELETSLLNLARSWELSEQSAFELNLVLDELCSNYIEHSGASASSTIRIKLSRDPAEMHISVSDCGPPFDPTAAPPPDLDLSVEERQSGGLGLHFVKHFSDQVLYSREHNENKVTIIKKLKTNKQG